MKLESVQIRRYKSINEVSLVDCGGFNVLIGRNNVGKSNILTAIRSFFASIEGGTVVNFTAPVKREIDFYDRRTDRPIELALTLSLSLAERDELVRSIVIEAPQVKNVTDGMDPELRLLATVTITPPPEAFSFISRLALVPPHSGVADREAGRDILRISMEAASELHTQLVRSHEMNSAAEFIDKLASRQIYMPNEFFKERNRRSARYLADIIGVDLSALSHDQRGLLDSILESSSSGEEFQKAAQVEARRLREEDAEARQREVLRNPIGTFGGEQTTIPGYALKLVARLAELRVHYLRERREDIGTAEARRLLSLKTRRGGPEVLYSLQKTVQELLGVQVDAFESEEKLRRPQAAPEMDVDRFLVEVNGAGIREALRIVLDYEFEKPSILLVEEPEIHLHPGLEVGLMHYLRDISSDCQIFITTHSTNFVDTADMNNIYMVSKPDSTHVERLDIETAEIRVPRELGLRLSSLFMYDRLVFVEGPSDESVFREWASTLSVNFGQSNVGFITMGGVRNFTHFAAEATLAFLSRRRVRVWFVLDRDERDEGEIGKLKSLVPGDVAVHFLRKREVENYLLEPQAICEFIAYKRSVQGAHESNLSTPSVDDIAAALDDAANQLKSVVIARRTDKRLCHPLYPSVRAALEQPNNGDPGQSVADEVAKLTQRLQSIHADFQHVHAEESEAVEREWSANKLSLVPGDMLLELVCGRFGVRFNKERDGARIAGFMNSWDISHEIAQIIGAIGTP